MDYDFLILGSGVCGLVAANAFIDLYPSNKLSDLRLGLIGEELLRPACSLKSLAIVSSFGIDEGASDWAKTLGQAREAFYLKVSQWNLSGVTEIDYRCADHSEVAHLVSVEPFLDSLKKRSNSHFQNIKKLVNSIFVTNDNLIMLTMNDGEVVSTRTLLVACGHAYEALQLNFPLVPEFPSWRSFTRRAPGYYALFPQVDYGARGFVEEFPKSQAKLVYRAWDKTMLLGSTTQAGDHLAPDLATLESYYEEAQSFLRDQGFSPLPDFSQGQIEGGVRLRGRKKRPFVGALHIDPAVKIFAFLAPYKSGYTLPFKILPEFLSKHCLGQ